MSALDDLRHSIEYDPMRPDNKPNYCNECDEALGDYKECGFNDALDAVRREEWRKGYVTGFRRAGRYIRGGPGMNPHRYNSGFFHDSPPGEAFPCCDAPHDDPIHTDEPQGDDA